MTPKETAERIVDNMKVGDASILNWTTGEMEYRPKNQYYKECALIVVDEIVKEYCSLNYGDHFDENLKYWQEVKQEIQRL